MNWTEVPKIDQNGVITQYEVMVATIAFVTINTTKMSVTLMDLEEYVEYNISVRAYTSVGPGPYSVGILGRTLQDGKLRIVCMGNWVTAKCNFDDSRL